MHVLSAHWFFFPLCTHRHCCCCLMLQFSSVPMLFCFTPTWIKYTHHISSQNPQSRIFVSLWAPVPRLLDFPSKQFKHSLFSGARPEYRLEEIQANRGLHTFLHNSCWGGPFQRRHLARSPCSGSWPQLFSVTFFFKKKHQYFCCLPSIVSGTNIIQEARA